MLYYIDSLNSSNRTDDLNNGFVSWAKQYIEWLETAQIALEEGWADK
jgi:hypothetical protein